MIFSRVSYYAQHYLLCVTPLFYLLAYPDLLMMASGGQVSWFGRVFQATAKAMAFKVCLVVATAWVSWATMANINLTLCPNPLPGMLKNI